MSNKPLNEPQTPLGKSLREIRDRMKAQGFTLLTFNEIDQIVNDEQPDALARLEAWLAGDERRTTRINYERYVSVQRWEVVLGRGCGFERHVYGYEMGVKGTWTAIAKAPGLAATIHAALDKADIVSAETELARLRIVRGVKGCRQCVSECRPCKGKTARRRRDRQSAAEQIREWEKE